MNSFLVIAMLTSSSPMRLSVDDGIGISRGYRIFNESRELFKSTGMFVDANPIISSDAAALIVQDSQTRSLIRIAQTGDVAALGGPLSAFDFQYVVNLKTRSYFVTADYYNTKFTCSDFMRWFADSEVVMYQIDKTVSDRVPTLNFGIPFAAGTGDELLCLRWRPDSSSSNAYPSHFSIVIRGKDKVTSEYPISCATEKEAVMVWGMTSDAAQSIQDSTNTWSITSPEYKYRILRSRGTLKITVMNSNSKVLLTRRLHREE